MNKRRLTFKRIFDAHTYRYSEPTITARFDSFGEGETNQIIVETEQTLYEDMNARCFVRNNEKHFLVGEVVNRLYEYEQLGYSPEELKEIIDDRKKLKDRLNSLYGTATFTKPFAETRSDAWVNTGVNIAEVMEKLRKQYANDTISLKAKIATLDEVNKNGTKVQYVDYCKADVENTLEAYGRIHRMSGPYPWGWNIPEIDNVIFNDPATIIFWKDGTKTVVKAEGEDFDPEKGLAMAISKKALGNQHEYYDVFKKWLKKFKPSSRTLKLNVGAVTKDCADSLKCASESARSLAATLRENAARENKQNAILALKKALHNSRATKEVLKLAMQDAITYLNKKEN